MYQLKEILDKNIWNNFITESNFEFYSFLQSWEWGEVQKKFNKKIIRYGIYNDKKLIGIFKVIINNAKRGKYYLIPHGPLISGNYFEIFANIVPKLKEIAKKDKSTFIRINSTILNTKDNYLKYKGLGFINAPMHEHAEDTHLLNLDLSEDELFNNIKKKDRYYINRAVKEGVEIRIDNKEDHIEKIIEMHTNHSKRDNGKNNYSAFSPQFIKNLYNEFGDKINTISASYNGKIESILMTIQFGKTCVYYIAASDIKSPKFSPNYLCQWEAIKNAKKSGALTYNFWGVSPDNNPKHPIAGVTKFKRKFSGYDYSLLHAQDLIISPKYYLNWLIETFRRKKRGYYYKKPL